MAATEQKTTAPKNACVFTTDVLSFGATADNPKDNTFAITCYDGSVTKHWYWGNLAIDMTGLKFAQKKLAILDEHDTGRRVGYTTKQSIDETVSVEGRFLSNADAQKLRQDILDGFPMQASLSGNPGVIEFVKDGQTAEVNDTTLKGPGAIWRKAVINEISMCTLGAMPNTESKAFADGGKDAVEFNIFQKETFMSDKTEPAKKLTVAEFAAQNPEMVAEITANAKAEGEKAVMDRFAKFNEAFSDDPTFVAEQFAKGASIEAAYPAYVAKLKNAKPAAVAAVAAEVKVDAAVAEFTDSQAAAPTAKTGIDAWKSEFAASQELQNEFSSEKNYLAFKQAESSGLVRIAKKNHG